MARLDENRFVGSKIAVPVTIYMPDVIYADVPSGFKIYVKVEYEGKPVTDAELIGRLYGSNGLIEESISTYISDGIYCIPFTDQYTRYGFIEVVCKSPYSCKGCLHLVRSSIKMDVKRI